MPISPTSAEIESAILDLHERYASLVSVRNVATTPQGRPFYAVSVTDPDSPNDDKQHALIVASQHGNEESGRLIALALLDWLTSDEAKEIRKCQQVVIIPNANPDGTDADTQTTSQGVNLNKDHAPAGATSPEGRALEQIAEELQPEAVADLHARGFAGCSYDMVLPSWTRPYSEDGRLAWQLADEMAAAGEAAGIPHLVHPLTWPGWWGDTDAQDPHTLCYAYRRFKSLCVLTETSEHNDVSFPPELRVAVGLARMRTFLDWGQRRHPSLCYSGYPVGLVTNMFHAGIAAIGSTAAERRRSRVEIWRQAENFKRLGIDIPERPGRKLVRCIYEGPGVPGGVGIQVRCQGRSAGASAELDGRQVAPDQIRSWQDNCSTFAMVNVPMPAAGEYELRISFGAAE